MRLLYVLPEYPPDHGGGISTFYGALLPALVGLGHEVHALVGSAFVEGLPPMERDGVRVTYLDAGHTDRLMGAYARYSSTPSLQRYLASARALWEQARGGEGYDRVEVTDWGLLFAPWVAQEGPPTLVRLHGSSGQIGAHERVRGEEGADQQVRLLEAGLLPHADALHTYSTANGGFWERMTGRDITVTPPPLPSAPVVRAGSRGTTGFVAGRIQDWKGPQVLAEALRQMGPEAPTVEWAGRAAVHPGTGRPYDEYLAEAFPDVWGKSLRPVGLVPPEEVARKQAAAAFVVVPSLWDVYNLTVAEAMQQGALLVCSDKAGGVDLVEDGVNGFSFRASDASDLVHTIRRAIAVGEEERAAMSAAARETVARVLEPDRVAAQVAGHLDALTGRPAPPPWLAEAVAPGEAVRKGAFLERLPLHLLVRHVGERLRAKAWGR